MDAQDLTSCIVQLANLIHQEAIHKQDEDSSLLRDLHVVIERITAIVNARDDHGFDITHYPHTVSAACASLFELTDRLSCVVTASDTSVVRQLSAALAVDSDPTAVVNEVLRLSREVAQRRDTELAITKMADAITGSRSPNSRHAVEYLVRVYRDWRQPEQPLWDMRNKLLKLLGDPDSSDSTVALFDRYVDSVQRLGVVATSRNIDS